MQNSSQRRYWDIHSLAWGFSFLLMGHNWLYVRGSPERQLSCLRRCHKPSKTSEEAQNVLSETVKLWGSIWEFPPESQCALTHWTSCFMGFPHPWHIRIANITSTDGQQNCNNPLLSLNSEVVVFFLSIIYFILSYSSSFFFPYLFILPLSFFLFLIFLHKNYFYSFLFLQKLPIPLFHCKQIVLE